VKRLTDKDVKKYYKRYEAYEGTKTTENLNQSFLLVLSKGVGMFVPNNDVEAVQKGFQEDYIINEELSAFLGNLVLRCGRLLAVAIAAQYLKPSTLNLTKKGNKAARICRGT